MRYSLPNGSPILARNPHPVPETVSRDARDASIIPRHSFCSVPYDPCGQLPRGRNMGLDSEFALRPSARLTGALSIRTIIYDVPFALGRTLQVDCRYRI